MRAFALLVVRNTLRARLFQLLVLACLAIFVLFQFFPLQPDEIGESSTLLDWLAVTAEPNWRHFMDNYPAYNRSLRGVLPGSRGINYLGTKKHIGYTLASVKVLRHRNCQLPIEFCYFDGDLGEEDFKILRDHNISVVDLSDPKSTQYPFRLTDRRLASLGQGKALCLAASKFDQVIFLDPDNFVTEDPSFLFESPKFLATGAIFWPDLWAIELDNYLFRHFEINTKNDLPGYEFESGQIVIDRPKVWKALSLCVFMSQNAGYYFEYVFGDKDVFRFAFRATNTPFAMSGPWLSWLGSSLWNYIGLAVDDYGRYGTYYCGEVMFQYAPIGPGEKYDVAPFNSTFDESSSPSPSLHSSGSTRSQWPKPLFVHANTIKYHGKYWRYLGRPFRTIQRYKNMAPGQEWANATRPVYTGCGSFENSGDYIVETIPATQVFDAEEMNSLYINGLREYGVY